MDQRGVVAGVHHRAVQGEIGLARGVGIVLGPGALQRVGDARQPVAVGLRGAQGGESGGEALLLAAVFEVIVERLAVPGIERQHRRRHRPPGEVCDVGAVAVAHGHQVAALQHLQRLAQLGPRHAQRLGEVALRGQPGAALQHAVDDHGLDLGHHHLDHGSVVDGLENLRGDHPARLSIRDMRPHVNIIYRCRRRVSRPQCRTRRRHSPHSFNALRGFCASRGASAAPRATGPPRAPPESPAAPADFFG